ncbi:MAG TPA: tetratricopeptide repeat protein [Stellaceae bacterium]|nr:tetratricopeptide repeat protein [Stellaceae bacterium]
MAENGARPAEALAPAPPAGAASAVPEAARAAFLAAAERQRRGDSDGALKLYQQALEFHPAFPDAYNNIGVILRGNDKLPAAAACFRRALAIRPDNAAVLSNLGNVLWQMLRFEPAAEAFRRSLALDPARPETLHNLGLLLHSMGDYSGAVDCFDKALRGRRESVDIWWDRALTLLAMGDFARGWQEYEKRWRLKTHPPRRIASPRWEGQTDRDLSLLVHFEQGLGDSIQFCRYLPLAAARVGRLVFECQPELARLMTGLPGVAEVIPSGRPLPNCDYHVPLMSLPGLLGTRLDSIPAAPSYLRAPADAVPPPLPRPEGTKLAIGIVWAGRANHMNDRNRSTTLERFLALADLPGVQLYSLQKGLHAADIQTLGAQALVRDLGSALTDFAATAALLPALDLVVSVDTAAVHLAGALGVRTFVAIPYTPDWRWFNTRDDTPWYPSLRLFRQPKPGDWESVFERIRVAVQALL